MELKKYHASILALTIIILVIRGAVLFYNVESFNADPDNYRALADNIQKEHVFGSGQTATAFRPPLYPLILTGVFSVAEKEQVPLARSSEDKTVQKTLGENLRLSQNASIALTHWILGVLTVFMTYFCGIYLKLSHKGAALAAFLVGIDPILLQQSRLVMTETLAAFFAALVLLLLLKFSVPGRNCLLSFVPGVLLGYAVLCRPAFLLWGALILIPLFFIKKAADNRFSLSVSLTRLLAFLLGMAIPLFPWALRNYREFHLPTPMTTHGGYTLLLANNDFLYDFNKTHRPWEARWEAEDFHQWWEAKRAEAFAEKNIASDSKEAELLQDQLAKSEAKKVIEKRSGDFWRAMAIRIGNLWQFLPYQTSKDESTAKCYARYAIGGFYASEFLLMIYGLGVLCFSLKKKKSSNLKISENDQVKNDQIENEFVKNDQTEKDSVENKYNENGGKEITSKEGAGFWFWPILLILSVQIPHLLFWTNMRMRAPVIIAVALLCGLLWGMNQTEKKGSSEEMEKISE